MKDYGYKLKKYRSLAPLLMLAVLSTPALAEEHHPEEFLASVQNADNKGEQIYKHFCASCHSPNPMIPIGAPCVGVKKDWEPYIKKQTIDEMVKTIDAGIGAMPARGGCFECSDEDLKAAIIFMLPKEN